MKEIGGYFGLEQFTGREYHHDLIGVNSGRNALLYILKARKYKKLYIPRFLCDSVAKLCHRENIAYEEYAINAGFLPIFERQLEQGEALYIVNYYGQISNEMVLEMKHRWGNIIFDNVQAFFQRPAPGIDTVYSCRKFFGVPDGGYVACDVLLQKLEHGKSRDKMAHILGRVEESGSAFYEAFQENEGLFYDMPLQEMSPLTRNILRAVDYDTVRRIRNENYMVLAEALSQRNPLNLIMPEGPYCYPFYCEDGMLIKKALVTEKIYIPTLWPNVLSLEGTLEKDYAENIMSLPCDQRYNRSDMERMIKRILKDINKTGC